MVAVFAASFVTAGLCIEAAADYRGPGARPGDFTVRTLLESAKDDQSVVLQGSIVRKLKEQRYVFSDGTGEVEIEIDNEKKMFAGHTVDDKTRVEISGEVEKDFLRSMHIDVKSLRLVEG
jgi:uncharacterized protein (TIGR00156 family)